MSKTTKRKHVMKEIFDDEFELPKENQHVVKILRSKGNNLHEVQSSENKNYLVTMPTKFRKNIWVKRGDFVLVEPILEGDKVKAEIIRILSNESIKFFKENHVWPKEFDDNKKTDVPLEEDDLFVNPNRINVNKFEESTSSSSSSSDEEGNT